jgi:invasion protein IalB
MRRHTLAGTPMRRAAAHVFCVLSLAGLSAVPAASDETKQPAPPRSPWIKMCFDTSCSIGAAIGTECELFAAELIEQNGAAKRTLQITLLTHVKHVGRLSLAVDKVQLIPRPFDLCGPYSCSATSEAGSELVDQLKRGQTLTVTASDSEYSVTRRMLPLAGFAKAYDGPSVQLKVFEEAQGKLSNELARRANEAPDQVAHEQAADKIRCPSQE